MKAGSSEPRNATFHFYEPITEEHDGKNGHVFHHFLGGRGRHIFSGIMTNTGPHVSTQNLTLPRCLYSPQIHNRTSYNTSLLPITLIFSSFLQGEKKLMVCGNHHKAGCYYGFVFIMAKALAPKYIIYTIICVIPHHPSRAISI